MCHWNKAVYYASGNPYNKTKLPIDRSSVLNDSINWLKSFYFNHPNSVFLIYSDHSHRVEPGYITWAYWKDNRNRNVSSLRPVISSYDIYSLILSIFNISPCNDILSESSMLPYNPERIYYTEDGRSKLLIRL